MHHVYMRFERIFDNWRVSFVDMDSKEELREFTFTDEFQVDQMAERAGALNGLVSRQALEGGLRSGSGAVLMNLTAEQYEKLKR